MQEYLVERQEQIVSEVQEIMERKTAEREKELKPQQDKGTAQPADKAPKEEFKREHAEKDYFDKWLKDFKIWQPTKYFLEHEINDTEIQCNL